MTENLVGKILNHIDILDKSTKTLGELQTKNAADIEAFKNVSGTPTLSSKIFPFPSFTLKSSILIYFLNLIPLD
jgi:hypothetical protein